MQYIMIERYFNFLVYIFTSDKYSNEIASLNSRLIHVLLAGGATECLAYLPSPPLYTTADFVTLFLSCSLLNLSTTQWHRSCSWPVALSTPIGVRSSKTIHMNSARMSSHCNVLLATTLPSISVSVRR